MALNIEEVFKLFANDGFKDPKTGLLFFPAYIYTYDPKDEYLVRKQIQELNNKLERPSNSLNSLVINIYEELINYFRSQTFSGKSILDFLLEKDVKDGAKVTDMIRNRVNDDFFAYLGEKFKTYFEKQEADKVYLFVYGFGSVYPYLRVSTFFKNLEQYVRDYKLIVFYPGSVKNETYSLFNLTNDENIYRVNHLNQLL